MILLYIITGYILHVLLLVRLFSLIDVKYIKYCELIGKKIDSTELAYNGGDMEITNKKMVL